MACDCNKFIDDKPLNPLPPVGGGGSIPGLNGNVYGYNNSEYVWIPGKGWVNLRLNPQYNPTYVIEHCPGYGGSHSCNKACPNNGYFSWSNYIDYWKGYCESHPDKCSANWKDSLKYYENGPYDSGYGYGTWYGPSYGYGSGYGNGSGYGPSYGPGATGTKSPFYPIGPVVTKAPIAMPVATSSLAIDELNDTIVPTDEPTFEIAFEPSTRTWVGTLIDGNNVYKIDASNFPTPEAGQYKPDINVPQATFEDLFKQIALLEEKQKLNTKWSCEPNWFISNYYGRCTNFAPTNVQYPYGPNYPVMPL